MIGVLRARAVQVAVALVAVALSGSGCSSGRDSQSIADGQGQGTAASADGTGVPAAVNGGAPATRKSAPAWASKAPNVVPAHVDQVSTVAQATGPTVAVYRTATGGTPWTTLKAPPGTPLVLLVQERRPGRVRVLLPVRPNGSQGWVRTEDVRLFRHDYRMVISVGKHTLTVYKGASVIMQEQVGLGRRATPTPGGVFYTKELLRPTNPKGPYGPYAYGLSGHSPVLDEFLGGDGQLGIHGTDDPTGLGRDVSHGCIRLRNAAIEKLAAMLPLGVPVQITG
jgi:lipoprotein-anchoring transpeptidase ErfK/SrfK